jgi:Mitochondrial carrier protein
MVNTSNDSNANSTPFATSSASSGGKIGARMIGSTIAGISELFLFHPVDTIAKRLMTNETRLVVAGSVSLTASNFNNAVFRDAAQASVSSKIGALFPGIGFGAAYKILQRIYKFGGHPIVRDWMKDRYGNEFHDHFGKKTGNTLLSACAGSFIGMGEVVLLPLDALKIKAQTAPEQLKGRGVLEIFAKEGFRLYRGAGWTVARNAPGSFALFGGNGE